jgi:hypothetical protein
MLQRTMNKGSNATGLNFHLGIEETLRAGDFSQRRRIFL